MAGQNKRHLFNLFMKLKLVYQRGTRRLLHLFATVLLCKFDSRNPYTSAIATQLIGKILSCLADSSIRCRLTTCNFWKLCITSTWKYGLPVHCVIHNSPQFRSEEFAHFMKVNGVKHVSFVSPIRENVLILVTFDRSTGVKRNAECEARSSERKRLQVPPST